MTGGRDGAWWRPEEYGNDSLAGNNRGPSPIVPIVLGLVIFWMTRYCVSDLLEIDRLPITLAPLVYLPSKYAAIPHLALR